jgi:Flp pilus assembly protein TadD
MRNYDKAVDTFSAATRIAPENGEVYYMLSMALSLAGQKEAAIVRATQSVEMFRRIKDEDNFIKAMALLQGLSAEKKPDIMVQ